MDKLETEVMQYIPYLNLNLAKCFVSVITRGKDYLTIVKCFLSSTF